MDFTLYPSPSVTAGSRKPIKKGGHTHVAMVCDRLVFEKSDKFETADTDDALTVGPDLIYRIIASPRRPRGKVSEA